MQVLAGLAPSSQTLACFIEVMRHYDQNTTMRHSVQPYKNVTFCTCNGGTKCDISAHKIIACDKRPPHQISILVN
jgi:hypothetical protein